MQRLQSAPLSRTGEETPPLQLLADPFEVHAQPLLLRLRALRDPDVTQQEVDTFLDGLCADLPRGESPRVRADLMLDVLEDPAVCALTASDGSRVGTIALEALMELGFPYALEVTPAMLKRARGDEPLALPRSFLLGLGLSGFSALTYGAVTLPEYVRYLDRRDNLSRHAFPDHLFSEFDDAVTCMPLFLLMLVGPAALSGLAGWLRLRGARTFFNVPHWLVGVWCLWLGMSGDSLGFDVNQHVGLLFLSGVMTLVSAGCLRPRPEPAPEPVSGPVA